MVKASMNFKPYFLTLPLFGLLLAGCEPVVYNRGAFLDPDKVAEISAGSSTREDVAKKLGTPTTISPFDEKKWYYVGRKTVQYSFLDPEVVDQQAYEVQFDDNGIVTSFKKLDPTLAENINPVDRTTPTYGQETTILEQLMGNLSARGLGSKK